MLNVLSSTQSFLESADEKTYNTKQKIMPNFDL